MSILEWREVENRDEEIPMYTLLFIGLVVMVVLGVPAIVWLTMLIRPPSEEEEKIHQRVEEARRRIDRFRY
ncbi:MAG TPA: hypothetical protein VLA02_08415 [Reyranella sp.]|nr:hypothetical protein [Reyranella sp.]